MLAETFAARRPLRSSSASIGPTLSEKDLRMRDVALLTAVDQVLDELDDSLQLSLPKALEQNRYIWARAMCRMKSMQNLI